MLWLCSFLWAFLWSLNNHWLMLWHTRWSRRCTLSMRWLLSCWLGSVSSRSYNIFVKSGKSRLRSTLLLLLLPIKELSPPWGIYVRYIFRILSGSNKKEKEKKEMKKANLTAAVAVSHPSGFILGIRCMRVVWIRWTIDEFPARYSSHK